MVGEAEVGRDESDGEYRPQATIRLLEPEVEMIGVQRQAERALELSRKTEATHAGDVCQLRHPHLVSHSRVKVVADVLERATKIGAETGGSADFVADPAAAVSGSDVVVTDTWVSMGKESEAEARAEQVFGPWRLDCDLLDRAAPDAHVLHCLPAHRGQEITAEVINGPRSLVWDEAENRRHVQKAVITWLSGGDG